MQCGAEVGAEHPPFQSPPVPHLLLATSPADSRLHSWVGDYFLWASLDKQIHTFFQLFRPLGVNVI